MSTLLEKLRGIEQTEREKHQKEIQDAQDEFVQLAVRDLLGKSRKNDAERLGAVLDLLGRSEDDYTHTVESLQWICELLGTRAYHDQALETLPDLEARAEKARQAKRALDELSRNLHEPINAPSVLTDRASRLKDKAANAKKRVPFVFDDEGNPHPALQPLIKLQFDRQSEQGEQTARSADEALAVASKLLGKQNH